MASNRSLTLVDNPRRFGTRVALVVDDERPVLERVRTWLAGAGWDCVCARSVSEALHASRDPTLVLALIDYRLDSGCDGIRLGRVLRVRRGLPFVLFSGYMDTDLAVSAMRAGAFDAIEKPLTENRLLASLRGIAMATDWLPAHAMVTADPEGVQRLTVHELGSTARRWSRMILRTCRAPDDPYKISLWADFLNLGEGVVRGVCRFCHVTANNSCDLARFLRAISMSRTSSKPLAGHFTVGDDRTLAVLFAKAGLDRKIRTVGLREFLIKQTFISTSKPCLRELAHLAANSQFFD